MELILLILKIVLIAFLIVLGIVLILVATILVVPIRYEVSGNIGDSWEIRVKGKITYLLSAIKVLFSYEKDMFDIKLFLFGFEKKFNEEETQEDFQEKDFPQEDVSVMSDAEVTQKESSHIEEATPTKETEEASTNNNAEVVSSQMENFDGTSEYVEESKQDNKKHKYRKQKDKKTASVDSKQKTEFNFAFIKQQITDVHNQSVVKKVWKELIYLLRHFGFRDIVTDLQFAISDPATTGQVLGALCMVPALYRYDFKVTPDFEADAFYIKGTFGITGRVRLLHIVIVLLRLIFDKEVRLVVKRVLALVDR